MFMMIKCRPGLARDSAMCRQSEVLSQISRPSEGRPSGVFPYQWYLDFWHQNLQGHNCHINVKFSSLQENNISKIFDTEVNQCMSDHVIDTSQNLKNFPLFQSYFKDFWSELV